MKSILLRLLVSIVCVGSTSLVSQAADFYYLNESSVNVEVTASPVSGQAEVSYNDMATIQAINISKQDGEAADRRDIEGLASFITGNYLSGYALPGFTYDSDLQMYRPQCTVSWMSASCGYALLAFDEDERTDSYVKVLEKSILHNVTPFLQLERHVKFSDDSKRFVLKPYAKVVRCLLDAMTELGMTVSADFDNKPILDLFLLFENTPLTRTILAKHLPFVSDSSILEVLKFVSAHKEAMYATPEKAVILEDMIVSNLNACYRLSILKNAYSRVLVELNPLFDPALGKALDRTSISLTKEFSSVLVDISNSVFNVSMSPISAITWLLGAVPGPHASLLAKHFMQPGLTSEIAKSTAGAKASTVFAIAGGALAFSDLLGSTDDTWHEAFCTANVIHLVNSAKFELGMGDYSFVESNGVCTYGGEDFIDEISLALMEVGAQLKINYYNKILSLIEPDWEGLGSSFAIDATALLIASAQSGGAALTMFPYYFGGTAVSLGNSLGKAYSASCKRNSEEVVKGQADLRDAITDYVDLKHQQVTLLSKMNDMICDIQSYGDTDRDGIQDEWEMTHFGDLITANKTSDKDFDTILDIDEWLYGLNPLLSDQDSDDMPDGWEFRNYLDLSTNDAADDFDSDGVSNLDEYTAGTDPTHPPLPNLVTRYKISANDHHVFMVTEKGYLVSWGYDSWGEVAPSRSKSVPTLLNSSKIWAGVGVGKQSSMAIDVLGDVYAQGSNNYGESSTKNTFQFGLAKISGSNWVEIAKDAWHTTLLKKDGTLWTVGSNYYGERGWGAVSNWTGDWRNQSVAKPNSSPTWIEIAAGYNNSLALQSDGSLWAWGSNSHGQLGNGSTSNLHVPTKIGSDKNWAKVAAGNSFGIAIKTDGSLWGWGKNADGIAGHTDSAIQATPLRIGTESDWVEIRAGYTHCLALKRDGTLWAWGNNQNGQLGVADIISRAFPEKVLMPEKVSHFDAGNGFSVAISATGKLYTWGRRGSHIGAATEEDVLSPLYIVTNFDDLDRDSLDDSWEKYYFNSTESESSDDPDLDGVNNGEEFQQATNPVENDTDFDGMLDGYELKFSLDVFKNDSNEDADTDGLSNIQESVLGTNPHLSDSDSDTMPDKWEYEKGLSPTVNDGALDLDGDGYSNLDEYLAKTNPGDPGSFPASSVPISHIINLLLL